MNAIDKIWFKAAIKKAGLSSQKEFAASVGLTDDKMSKTLGGSRDVSAEEIDRFAQSLKTSPSEIKRRLGMDAVDGEEVRVAGYVSAAGAVVVIDGEFHDSYETVTVPFYGYPGVIIEVRGDSMLPRYSPGELLGVRPHQTSFAIDDLVGRDVVAKLDDGSLVVKTLARAPDGKYALLSVNSAISPIYAAVEWASPIDFHIPRPKK